MTKFSTKELLIGTAMVAVGMFLAVGSWKEEMAAPHHPPTPMMYFIGCGIAGAGLFHPFKNRMWGILIGCAVGVLVNLAING